MEKLVILTSILVILLAAIIGQIFLSNSTSKQATSLLTQMNTAIDTAKIIKPTPSPQLVSILVPSGKQIKVPILLYHYIGNNPDQNDKARDVLSIAPDKFDEQMGYLSQNGFSPITLDTMVAGLRGVISLPAKPVVLTFDDGYIDLYFNAFGILKKYNFHAVAFIPTGLVGTKYYASWDELQEMQTSGLLSFQSHSVFHSNLINSTNEQLTKELTESKKTLEAKFGIPVNFIAYPYGTSSPAVWEATKKAGYVGGLGTWYSNIQSEGTIYNMPRIKISGSWDLATFASKL